MHLNATGVQFEISRIPLTGVVTRFGWIAENVFGSLISTRLILYNASGVPTNVPFFKFKYAKIMIISYCFK
jgi:hypothetical protein